jgi:hypothetical protein
VKAAERSPENHAASPAAHIRTRVNPVEAALDSCERMLSALTEEGDGGDTETLLAFVGVVLQMPTPADSFHHYGRQALETVELFILSIEEPAGAELDPDDVLRQVQAAKALRVN